MLLSFKDYLVEAQFSEDDFERVLSVFTKRLPRLLGSKIYRYGGPGYVEKVGGGNRITFIFKDKAYGVFYKGGSIKGIHVWDHFGTQTAPSHFIDVSKLSASSILGAVNKLAQIIKNPKEGDIEVKQIKESVKLDEMASRISNDQFYKKLVDEYGEKGARSLSWQEIKDVADQEDVLIPGYIKANKIGKGQWDGKPKSDGGESSSSSDEGSDDDGETIEVKTAGGQVVRIKVMALDPETQRLMPAGDSKAAKALYSKIHDAVSGPPTEEEMRDVDTLYGHLGQLVEFACDGKLKSLLIYGGPGTGKTFTIMKVIKDKGLVSGKDYVKMSGKASPIKIYETLFMYRNGGMVVFDDLDSMWRNEDATNILKAALDTSPVREISWDSNNTANISKMSKETQEDYMARLDRQIAGESEPAAEDDEDDDYSDSLDDKPKKGKAKAAKKLKFPATFEFTGRVVFISNLKKEEFDTAIMSRSAKIDMSLTAQEMLKRMRAIIGGLGGDDVPIEKKTELLDHLLHMNKSGELDQVTMREFIKGMNILRSGAPNWKDLVKYS